MGKPTRYLLDYHVETTWTRQGVKIWSFLCLARLRFELRVDAKLSVVVRTPHVNFCKVSNFSSLELLASVETTCVVGRLVCKGILGDEAISYFDIVGGRPFLRIIVFKLRLVYERLFILGVCDFLSVRP